MSGDEAISVTGQDLEEDRFDRFRQISWWNQDKISQAKVLVVGAGALGNEIIKNLALLGFRQIVIVDLDAIELSNLTRSVLYRPDDVGRDKAGTAAAAATALYEEATIHPISANILHEVGLGVFDWADLVFAGLDNREARLWINRCAWKMNRPWIDGAIEGINGVARVFLPGQPPCYECTLGETDWEILEKRMSCNLLTREELLSGKTATTPTVSSVIAGIQVQEGLKLLHDLPVLAGKGFVFEGLNHTSYTIEYTENPDCMSHEAYTEIQRLDRSSANTTPDDLLDYARSKLAVKEVQLDFSRDVIHQLACPECGASEDLFAPVGSVSAASGKCPEDGTLREVIAAHSYDGSQDYGSRPLAELGLPLFDVVVARTMKNVLPLLLAKDATSVLGPLAEELPQPNDAG